MLGGPLLEESITGIVYYLRNTEDPSLEGFGKELASYSEGSTYTFGLGLLLAVDVASVSENGLFTYTMRVHGSYGLDMDATMGERDPDHPDIPLSGTYDEDATLDALVTLVLTDKREFVSLSVASDITYRTMEKDNFGYDYSDLEYVYSETPVVTEDSATVSTDLLVESDRLSLEDLEAFIAGAREGGIVVPEKDVSLFFSTITERNGLKDILGFDLDMPLSDIARLLLGEDLGDGIGDYGEDTVITVDRIKQLLTYDGLEKVLEACGLFISEEEYDDLKDTLLESRSYYFKGEKQAYNTGLKETIDGKMGDVPGRTVAHVFDIDGYHLNAFSKDPVWSHIRVECSGLYGEAEKIFPETVCGFPIVDESQSWGFHAFTDYTGSFTYSGGGELQESFRVAGSPNEPTFVLFKDGVRDDDLLGAITYSATEDEGLVDGWEISIHMDDIADFQNCEFIISWDIGSITYRINTDSSSGTSSEFPEDWTAVVDGVEYYYDLKGAAFVIGDADNDGSIRVPEDVTIKGAIYEVFSIRAITADELTIVLPKDCMLPYIDSDCSIRTLHIVCEGNNTLYLYYINNISSLQELTITGDIWRTSGTVDLEGYHGIGSSMTVDNVLYELRIWEGEERLFAVEITEETETVTVPGSVLFGDVDRDVYGLFIDYSMIDTLILEADISVRSGQMDRLHNLVIRGTDASAWMMNSFINTHAGRTDCFLAVQEQDGSGAWIDMLRISDFSSFDEDGRVTVDGAAYRIYVDDEGPYASFSEFVSEVATVRDSIVFGEMTLPLRYAVYAVGDSRVSTLYIESIPKNGLSMDRSSVEEVVFKNTAQIYNDFRFQYCSNLESVVFNGPIDISNSAFYGSTEIKTLEFNSSIGEIGSSAFVSNSRLTELTFNGTVDTIDYKAFAACTNLKKIVFKEYVCSIAWNAFKDSENLTSIVFVKDVGTIHGSTGCNALRSISAGGSVEELALSDGKFAFAPIETVDGASLRPQFSITVGGTIGIIANQCFSEFNLSEDTIATLLSKSELAYPESFSEVIIGYDQDTKALPYAGVCSGGFLYTEDGNGIGYEYKLYVDDGSTAIEIVGVFLNWDTTSVVDIELTSLTVDGKDLPIKALGLEFATYDDKNGSINLALGPQLKRIGAVAAYIFDDKSILSLTNNSDAFEIKNIGGSWLVSDTDGKPICFLGRLSDSTTDFTVPDGFDTFDLSWIASTHITSFSTGDAEKIHGQWGNFISLKTLKIGPSTSYIGETFISESVETITVDSDNKTFAVVDGALYSLDAENNEAELIWYPAQHAPGTDLTVKSEILGTYTVTGIGDYAFAYSDLKSITIEDGVLTIGHGAFMYSQAQCITLPPSITSIGAEAFLGCKQSLDVGSGSETENEHHTADGAIYVFDGNDKILIGYVGDSDYLLVEEGTTIVRLSEDIKYLIVPQETREVYTEARHVLIPSDCRINGNTWLDYKNSIMDIRTYTVSDDYDVKISLNEDNGKITGVRIEYVMEDYAKLESVTFIGVDEEVTSLAPVASPGDDTVIVFAEGDITSVTFSDSQKVYLDGDVNLIGDMVVHNLVLEKGMTLTIASGAKLTIAEGGTFEARGTLQVYGTLTIGKGSTVNLYGGFYTWSNSELSSAEDATIVLGKGSEMWLYKGTTLTTGLSVVNDGDIVSVPQGNLEEDKVFNGPGFKWWHLDGVIKGRTYPGLEITGDACISEGDVIVTDYLYIDTGCNLLVKEGASLTIKAGAVVVINGSLAVQFNAEVNLKEWDWSFIWGIGILATVPEPPSETSKEPSEEGSTAPNAFILTWSELFPKTGTFNGTSFAYGGNDADIVAHYSVKEFTVSFETGTDAIAIEPQTIKGGTTADSPVVPERAGFTFDGWFTDEGLTEEYDFRTIVTKDITLYAKWVQDSDEPEDVDFRGCILYVECCDGMMGRFIVDDKTALWTYETWEEKDNEWNYYNYIFLPPGQHTITPQFYNGYSGADIVVDLKATEGRSYTEVFYPYSVESEKVTMTFVNDNSKGTSERTTAEAEVYSYFYDLPDVVAKDGFRFVGWVSNHVIHDSVYVGLDGITLTAAYVREKVELFDVTFRVQGNRGTVDGDTSMSVAAGTTITLPDVSPASGYRFDGWYIDGKRINGTTYTVTKDTVLTANMSRVQSNPGGYTPGGQTPGGSTTPGGQTPGGSQQGGSQTTVDEEGNKTTTTTDRYGNTTSTTTKVDGTVISSSTSKDGTTSETETRTDGTIITTTTSKDGSTSSRTENPDGSSQETSISKDGTTIEKETQADGSSVSTTTRTDGSTVKVDTAADGSSVVTDTKPTENGSQTTETAFDENGRPTGSTETTTVVSDEKTVSTSTEFDASGKPTGKTSETTTSKDGSSVKVETVVQENGSTVKEEVFDTRGNLSGSTLKETETSVTESGSTMESVKTTASDGDGNVLSSTTEIRAESESGEVTTSATTRTDADGKTESKAETTIASASENGSVTVDADTVQDALRQMEEVASAAGGEVAKTVTVSTSEYTPDKADMTVSSDILRTVAESGADMKLAGDVGTVSVSPEASKNLASSGEHVNVSIGKASKAGLNTTQQTMVGDNPLFQLEASVGGDSVHELGGDVTVTIPYVLKDGQDPDSIVVYYVDDGGNLHVRTTTYDPATNTVTFVTDHFSYYMIGETGMEMQAPASDDGTDGMTMVYAAVAVIAVLVVAAVVLLRSKKI